MKVYRIEHPEDCTGPYCRISGTKIPSLRESHVLDFFGNLKGWEFWIEVNGEVIDLGFFSKSSHPDVRHKINRQTEICGFSSMRQLRAWFDELTLLCLSEAGYKLALYSCPDHLVFDPDDKQVLFSKDSERIEYLEILEIC